ncbi:MAG: tetratricopeptide repeat protein [Desulfuromonadaceae bacterium]
MKLHPEVEAAVELERAREALAARQTLAALAHLEKALKLQDNPSWYSYLGYCIAKQRGQIKKGIDLCLISLELEREEPVHYLNLGNIYLVSGNKSEALRVFREGIVRGNNEEIQSILDEIGMRKPPIIKSLPRNNPVNRFLGIFLSKIGLR